MKKILLLGATGSVGKSTLEVVRKNSDKFKIVGASAHNNFKELEKIAEEFGIEKLLDTSKIPLNPPLKKGALEEFIKQCEPDIVLNAVTGFAGLKFTIATLELGIPLALANKESLVAAGELVMELSRRHNAPIIPVDSEHSAIFQCLITDSRIPSVVPTAPLNPRGANIEFKKYEKILLTCSGGPFFGWNDLSGVTREQALRHPNWDMGAKITIDSATLANKCLEFFEAMHLFGASKDQIEIIIHRESIIHSMVEFSDSSIIAQMSTPSMELPIGYALNFPERQNYKLPKVDFKNLQLNFAEPDKKVFRTLQVLDHCAESMGSLPLVFNAANEEARNAFIEGKISFERIFEIIEQTVTLASPRRIELLDDINKIYEVDERARKAARDMI